ALENLRIALVHAGQQAAAQALGGQLYRRERILDLVRQAARHFAPGRVALRLQERGDVVEHDDETHVAVLAGERGAGAHERAAPGDTVEVKLFAPLLAAAGEAHRERGDELAEALVAAGQLRQGASGGGRQIRAENR